MLFEIRKPRVKLKKRQFSSKILYNFFIENSEKFEFEDYRLNRIIPEKTIYRILYSIVGRIFHAEI